METTTTTQIATDRPDTAGPKTAAAGLLIAYSAGDQCNTDRVLVQKRFFVGRSTSSDLYICDSKLSRRHFSITPIGQDYILEDLHSTNGTFVDGNRIQGQTKLHDGAIIRAGYNVLLFHENVLPFISPHPSERYGMRGRFHTGPILRVLEQAAISDRHILIYGPSGTGKELAASALAEMMEKNGSSPLPLLKFNAARMASMEEITSTLFGVVPRFFSNVAGRSGLIEDAHGKALFIDEIHNFPNRIQRSLLRVIEEGEVARLGQNKPRPADVRFLFASNQQGKTRGLSHDLFARLRLVELPPLNQRIADIPDIFAALLDRAFCRQGQAIDAGILPLNGEHFEVMCLHGFPNRNIRGLVDLADRLVTSVVAGRQPIEAINEVFAERFAVHPKPQDDASQSVHALPDKAIIGGTRDNLLNTSTALAEEKDSVDTQPQHQQPEKAPKRTKSNRYELNKPLIIETFQRSNFSLIETKDNLQKQGIECSQRWLSIYLERWGVRAKRARSR
ncbi:MAG: sigma 54-interacting transcriptional regulator [Myxococcota bacterium]|nr:sigma 54-interacting transcriptional regulator [Myxococcota bacterium]